MEIIYAGWDYVSSDIISVVDDYMTCFSGWSEIFWTDEFQTRCRHETICVMNVSSKIGYRIGACKLLYDYGRNVEVFWGSYLLMFVLRVTDRVSLDVNDGGMDSCQVVVVGSGGGGLKVIILEASGALVRHFMSGALT